MAQFNKKVTNRVTRHVAPWAPGFAVVHHRGRRSGKAYDTPVNVFTNPGEFVFALTYGEAEWVRNVVAAGGCEITSRRRTVELRDPELYRDPDRKGIPIPARWMLGALRVDEFLRMKETHNPAPS